MLQTFRGCQHLGAVLLMVALTPFFSCLIAALFSTSTASPTSRYDGRNVDRRPSIRDGSTHHKRETGLENSTITTSNLVQAYWDSIDGLTLPLGLHKSNNVFKFRLDLQASDLTVLSSSCNASQCLAKQLYRNSSTSIGSIQNPDVEVFTDDIFFNDIHMNITNQTIIASREYLSALSPDTPVAGILGLGAFNTTFNNASTLLANVPPDTISSSLLSVNSTDYFALYLDDHTSLPSFLCINCLDPTTLDVSQAVNYASVLPDRPNVNDWHLSNVSVNVTTSGNNSITLEQDVFDTVFNATLNGMYAPNHVVEELYKSINGSTSMNTTWQGEPVRVWQYNCTKSNNQLHVQFQWTGLTNNGSESSWSIMPETFNQLLIDSTTHKLTGACQGALMAPVDDSRLMINTGDKNITIWQLGTPILTQFYGIFDRENQRVGFGKKKSIEYRM